MQLFFATFIDQNALNAEMLISTVAGLSVGAIASFIVNVALVEISLNTFFSLYYSAFFFLLGGMLLYSACKTSKNSLTNDNFPAKREILTTFGFFSILTGALCILLDKNWFASIGSLTKIPMYMMLGSSICFVMVVAIVDTVDWIRGHLGKIKSQSLIHKPFQILALAVLSLACGAIYGLLFGCMKVEDADGFTLHLLLMKEEKYCLVIGVLLGAMGGMLSELARKNMTKLLFQKIPSDPFEEEI